MNAYREAYKGRKLINWEAVKDLMDQSKILQAKYPLISNKIELWIPIELMQQATDYAHDITLDVTLKDLSKHPDRDIIFKYSIEKSI